MAMYGKPAVGICVVTAAFICGTGGYPSPAPSLPESDGVLEAAGEGDEPLLLESGDSLLVQGIGFDENAAVTIALYSEPLTIGQTTADSSGGISETVTVPAEAPEGSHTLVAMGNAPDGSAHVLQLPVLIEGPGGAGTTAQPAPSPELPVTGLRAGGLAVSAVVLLLMGFVLVRTAVYRRRFLPPARHEHA